MTEPRTRTAAEVADAAADGVETARELLERARDASSGSTYAERITAGLLKRLAEQVEDLAAVVARQALDRDEDWPEPPAPFPPVEWPLAFNCQVDGDRYELTVYDFRDGHFYFQSFDKRAGAPFGAVLSAHDARLLAQAILDRLDGVK